jgi:DNA primase
MEKYRSLMIDVNSLKAQIDLLALVEQHTSLRRVASSGGGEWAGACPFCGGVDRFRVQPQTEGGGRWLCRGCSDGKWQDALEFGKCLWPGLSFIQVCELLGSGAEWAAYSREKPSGHGSPSQPPEQPAAKSPAYAAPANVWQSAARQAVLDAERALWGRGGQTALTYLHSRGLKDEPIRYWRMGWSEGVKISLGESELWLPRGVVIPCISLGEVWYLKIALLPGQMVKCQGCGERVPARKPCPKCSLVNKYRGVKGNRTAAVFGADDLPGMDQALFVEGEFDAMIAWQELHDVIAVCTLGSAGTRPDLATWGAHLLPLERIFAAYDADEAGKKGLAALRALSERVIPCTLPPGAKDINDFVLRGGDLWPWLKAIVIGVEG